MHVLNGYSYNFALTSTNYQISIGQHSHNGHSKTKQPFYWSNSSVYSFLDIHFKNISCFCTTVNIPILEIKSSTCEMSFDVTKVSIERLYFFVDLVDSQNLNATLLHSYESVTIIVEENNFIDNFFIGSTI